MIKDGKITTYLCCENKDEGVEVNFDVSAVAISDRRITAKLFPLSPTLGCDHGRGNIEALMVRDTMHVHCNDTCGVDFYRNEFTNGKPGSRIRLEVDIPTDLCSWKSAFIMKKHGTSRSLIYGFFPLTGGGPIPHHDDDLVFRPDVNDDGVRWVEKGDVDWAVPGDLIYADIFFTDGKKADVKRCSDEAYYGTCCFIGGRITSVVGVHGEEDVEYVVEAQGSQFSAYPTDFTEWAVGDWVYLYVMGATSCFESGREYGCMHEARDWLDANALGQIDGEEMRILPIKVGGVGA